MGACRHVYDPAAARAATEQLAALTDDQAAAAIRAAAADVLDAVQAWRSGPRWHGLDHEGDAYATATDVASVLDALPTDAELAAVVDAVGPLLGIWWPAPVEAMMAALRNALAQPRMARQCRALLPHLDWIIGRERQVGWA